MSRQINSNTWIQLLEKLNATPVESWTEGNFSYAFLRLGNKANVLPHNFLKATNLVTEEEKVVKLPASIFNGQEALNWAKCDR